MHASGEIRYAQTVASLKAVLDCVALPVWVVDADGIVQFANPAACAALGYDQASQLRGRRGHDTMHYKRPDGTPFPAADCPLLEPVRTGEPVHSDEDWFIRRDGTLFPVSYTAVPIDTPEGRGVVVTFIDLTEQRAAEQALRERDAILAQVAQPVWVVDHEGHFRYANPAAVAALGYDDASELVGRPGHDTVHYKYPDGTPFPESECAVARARDAGEIHSEREDWLVRKDGSILRIAYTTAPFQLPDGLGAVTAFSDIEAQLEAERVARERDVAEARTAELEAARRRIIEAGDNARAHVTRDLHDGAQQLFVSALINLRMAERKGPGEAGEARGLLESASEQVGEGIAQLRELAAGIHPSILGERGLGAALNALAARLPLPVTVALELERRLPPPVEASVYFFVSEALTNVVKHARASSAHVGVGVRDDHLIVEVRDDGAGGATTVGGGSGLAGLADRIAALDGELAVLSAPASGTTLHAEIPLR